MKHYTPAEEAFIFLFYDDLRCDDIGMLIGRTGDSIQHKAYMMQITREDWTAEEEAYLIKHYTETDMAILMRELGRNYRSITRKANRMGIARNRSVNNFYAGRSMNGLKRFERPAPVRYMASHLNTSISSTVQPFTSTDKILLRIDRRTQIYVPASASPKIIEKIINTYKKSESA